MTWTLIAPKFVLSVSRDDDDVFVRYIRTGSTMVELYVMPPRQRVYLVQDCPVLSLVK